MMWRTPMITQSVGVPLTAKWRGADLAQPQRIVERERMRDARLVEFRRHHPDVVGERARDLARSTSSPRRVNAVVIGDEDAHPLIRRVCRSHGRDRLHAAHIGLQRVGHHDRAVGLLVGLHHRDQRAADRDAGAVERVDEARRSCRPCGGSARSCGAPGNRRNSSRTRFRGRCSGPAATPRCRRSSAAAKPMSPVHSVTTR